MRFKKIVAGVGGVAAISACLTLLPSSAFADYGPSSGDVVGVGSDTLQAAGDFIADGDYVGDAGYNTAGNLNKFINVDATADANTRLAYAVTGKGDGSATACPPGTGATQGTGNSTTNHADAPCALNPTVVLRAGLSPVQRPNGSGAGFNLLKADTNTTTGVSINGLVDFSRASSARTSGALFDSIQIGNDPLGMLTAGTTHVTNTLTIAQLKSIYNCTSTNWSAFGTGTGTIIPLVPQVGSGTRSYFLGQIGLTDTTLGTCVQTVEENDPEAVGATASPADAIEPMSQSRLYLFQGKLSNGTASGATGYFKDPSCVALSTATGCASTANTIAPSVRLWTSADPAPVGGGTAFYQTRPLYIYFRHADIASTKPFQPGGTLNWVKTMLYNPGGATPYWCSGAGQADISSAGIIPACTYTQGGP